MGMDWHSSGITTCVLGALKRGLAPVAGGARPPRLRGRGRHSRKTPDELLAIADRTGLDGVRLAQTSRLVAKVDSAAVQDGFALYLHGFIVADDGKWTVVQQGMNAARTARRYHWLSEGVTSFVDEPHAAIEGQARATSSTSPTTVRNRSALPARAPRRVGPRRHRSRAVENNPFLCNGADRSGEPLLPHLHLPAHHDVRPGDLVETRLYGNLAAAADRGPRDFPELLLTPGVGARTVQALAMVAEIVHGAPYRFTDPARFLRPRRKGQAPLPGPLRVYDETIRMLKSAVGPRSSADRRNWAR